MQIQAVLLEPLLVLRRAAIRIRPHVATGVAVNQLLVKPDAVMRAGVRNGLAADNPVRVANANMGLATEDRNNDVDRLLTVRLGLRLICICVAQRASVSFCAAFADGRPYAGGRSLRDRCLFALTGALAGRLGIRPRSDLVGHLVQFPKQVVQRGIHWPISHLDSPQGPKSQAVSEVSVFKSIMSTLLCVNVLRLKFGAISRRCSDCPSK